ncbi:hypothetical protein BT96DRAFT_978160 [Gymnopus androsaceus JB14]|uniref:Uncharacterized protein n=1 Tax=Gymnopus androsaceus JB14 TaxID=1447944 RepID=A0A6A4HBX1_9AGAR|nr:hypothetical protein BT96DRAFT_978160 [Gymnopus androsaceus JB14]
MSSPLDFILNIDDVLRLSTKARQENDPLASCALMTLVIGMSYERCPNSIKPLIAVVYKFGLEKIRRNDLINQSELQGLEHIRCSIHTGDWEQLAQSVDSYIIFFGQTSSAPVEGNIHSPPMQLVSVQESPELHNSAPPENSTNRKIPQTSETHRGLLDILGQRFKLNVRGKGPEEDANGKRYHHYISYNFALNGLSAKTMILA